MFGLIVRLVLNALALLAVPFVVHGVHVDGFGGAIIAALILGIVNAVIRPVVYLITLPAVVITLGLFTFVINALMLLIVSAFNIGFHVDGLGNAILGSIVLSIISWVLSMIVKTAEEPEKK